MYIYIFIYMHVHIYTHCNTIHQTFCCAFIIHAWVCINTKCINIFYYEHDLFVRRTCSACISDVYLDTYIDEGILYVLYNALIIDNVN